MPIIVNFRYFIYVGKWVCSKCVLELGVDSTQQMELDIDREVSHDSISTSTTGGVFSTHWNLPSAATCNNNCRLQEAVFV